LLCALQSRAQDNGLFQTVCSMHNLSYTKTPSHRLCRPPSPHLYSWGEFKLTRRASPQRDHEAPFQDIPSHGRYQHFCVGGRDRIAELLGSWPDSVDNTERCRRLVDLFFISVLLDAGAGTTWTYKSVDNGKTYRRSEGIAIASLENSLAKTRILTRHHLGNILCKPNQQASGGQDGIGSPFGS
jgi:hypothetical protein